MRGRPGGGQRWGGVWGRGGVGGGAGGGVYRIGGLLDWGIYRIGIYWIGARQSVGGAESGLVGGMGRSKTLIGSAIVAMAAAIVTIASVVIAVLVEPQKSWS